MDWSAYGDEARAQVEADLAAKQRAERARADALSREAKLKLEWDRAVSDFLHRMKRAGFPGARRLELHGSHRGKPLTTKKLGKTTAWVVQSPSTGDWESSSTTSYMLDRKGRLGTHQNYGNGVRYYYVMRVSEGPNDGYTSAAYRIEDLARLLAENGLI